MLHLARPTGTGVKFYLFRKNIANRMTSIAGVRVKDRVGSTDDIRVGIGAGSF